jgi:hypothetical protein
MRESNMLVNKLLETWHLVRVGFAFLNTQDNVEV